MIAKAIKNAYILIERLEKIFIKSEINTKFSISLNAINSLKINYLKVLN